MLGTMWRCLSAFFLVLALAPASARADIVDRLDQAAPEIAATTWWNGTAPKMESLRGKVVILHVTDPARATSKAFLPNLVKLAAAWKAQPVVIVEMVLCDDAAGAASYVAENAADVKWLVGFDASGAFQRGYPGTSVPRTYLIGPDGKVAWHAHIAALTKEIVDAQVTRCTFADVKSVPDRARPAAKAMLEMRFGDAIAAADKVFTDATAPGDAKAYCAKVKKEVGRYYAFQKSLVDALVKDLDWAVAYRRMEKMLIFYKDTEHEPEVQKKKDELDANPRVKFIIEAQNHLDDMVKDIGHMGPRDLEKLIDKLKAFIERYPESAPAKKAGEWIEECERRMKKFAGK